MLKMYRKIGGNNGSALLSLGAGISQGGTGETDRIWQIEIPIVAAIIPEFFISEVILA